MENDNFRRESEVSILLDMIGGDFEQELKGLNLAEKERRLIFVLIKDILDDGKIDCIFDYNEDNLSEKTVLDRISSFLLQNLSSRFDSFQPDEFFSKSIFGIYKSINLNISMSPIPASQDLLTFALISKLTSTNQTDCNSSIILRYLDLDLITFLRDYSSHVHIETFTQCKSFFPRPSPTCSIIVSKSYSTGNPGTAQISQDKLFQFSSKGKSEYNDRSDNLIIIGTSKFCNIILPKDTKLNLASISVIIYLAHPQVFIQDLNEETPTLIKLNSNENNGRLSDLPILKEGDVINISRLYDFYIEKIKFQQLDSNEQHRLGSSLAIRWINSPLQGRISKIRTYAKQGKTYTKSSFILGRGGDGIVPDIPTLASLPHIGKVQLTFICQGGHWHIQDNNSKNFSFIAIKPYQSSQCSPVPLPLSPGSVGSTQSLSVFCIGRKYMFIIRFNNLTP